MNHNMMTHVWHRFPVFLICFFMFVFSLPMFSAQAADSVAQAEDANEQQAASPLHIVMAQTQKGETRWHVELAATLEKRTMGLMYRKSMPQNHGMLFRFDESKPIFMWMKNTYITLDMVFIDPYGKITYIQRSAMPLSDSIISSRGPVRFVLELNAGQVDQAGLKTGDFLKHPWFLNHEKAPPASGEEGASKPNQKQ